MDTPDQVRKDRFRQGNPFHAFLGVELEEQAPGYARIRLPASDKLGGGVGGSIHGGVLSALADIACLGAMQTVFDSDSRPAGTAELSISYLRPAAGPYVIAEARVLKKGRTLSVVDVDIANPDGKLAAKCRVTYVLRPVSG